MHVKRKINDKRNDHIYLNAQLQTNQSAANQYVNESSQSAWTNQIQQYKINKQNKQFWKYLNDF